MLRLRSLKSITQGVYIQRCNATNQQQSEQEISLLDNHFRSSNMKTTTTMALHLYSDTKNSDLVTYIL
jgi:hypothetical protein